MVEREKQHALEFGDLRSRDPVEYGPNIRPFPDYDDRKTVWDHLSRRYDDEWGKMTPDEKNRLLERTIRDTVEAIRKTSPGIWESLSGKPQERRELFFAQFVERNAPRAGQEQQYEQFRRMRAELTDEPDEGTDTAPQEPESSGAPVPGPGASVSTKQRLAAPPPFGAWAYQQKKPLNGETLKEYKKEFGLK